MMYPCHVVSALWRGPADIKIIDESLKESSQKGRASYGSLHTSYVLLVGVSKCVA